MKTKSKALLLALCAVLLVAASVLGTLAYLTSDDQVTNTFTVGSVTITLDEAQVNPYGKPAHKNVDDQGNVTYEECELKAAERVEGNEYKLIPGHTYTKDPTITVGPGSENCWLFAKIENGLSAAGTIVVNENWNLIDEANNVYAYKTVASANNKVTVFDAFTFAGDADPDTYKDNQIVVTAYAVQADGFDTAIKAWNATFGAPVAG